ncbi:MAG: AAA family ATPase [Phascolarctobacterium sp.]|nr:AAA family ATPase [Phascolarctobacterium sp.]MBR6636900.1 AAA family ATPase [Phascolarctobacterium sp.]
MFTRAERKRTFLKIALCGVSGSGKTYSALQLAKGLGKKIAMIDTENGSGEMYSHLCDYDVAQLEPPFSVQRYIDLIKMAEKAGYDVLIIDSLSQAWNGEGGILEMVDKLAATSRNKNSFNAWKDVTPEQNKLINTILQCKMHVIATMRSKTAYDLQDQNGKKVPVKIGLAPVQRDGVEYEFTIVFDLSVDKNFACASKDRTGLFNGWIDVITPNVGEMILDWAISGAEVTQDAYVKISNETTLARGNNGFVDIRTLDNKALEFLLKNVNYQLAHPAIEELLKERLISQKPADVDLDEVLGSIE